MIPNDLGFAGDNLPSRLLRPLNIARSLDEETKAMWRWMFGFALIFVATVLSYVWIQIETVSIAYERKITLSLLDKVKREGSDLEFEKAKLEGVDHIGEVARRMGMGRPLPGQERALP